ncbi:hypothetical protein AAFC00_004693 [Neodothiora populina]|uniref:Hyaluronan/mRNA-binding protein domain-containing protein n=1 Tax=Neodothiora populina TaxID=2781224 RepID=A0ABR3P494_9PEZI
MSNSLVSKVSFNSICNDPELDPNRPADPPVKVVDKPAPRAGKRNGTTEAPVRDSAAAPARGGRKEAFTGSEQAIRDKTAGSYNNRSKPTDDGLRSDRHRHRAENSESRGRGGRGGRGGQGRAPRTDRHDRTGVAHAGDKQAAHAWGGETGDAEFADEKAGLADARAEEKEGVVATDSTPVDADGEKVPELEDNTKSYEQYLAEQLEKKAALNAGPLEPRKANEGSSKKFPEGKAFTRNAEEAFIEGTAGKAQRHRERKAKEVVDVDLSWKEEAAGGDRGADRGAPRGGRGGRGRGGPRGGDRGDRGNRRGGDRPAAPRGPAARTGPSPNVTSAQDFPSLS